MGDKCPINEQLTRETNSRNKINVLHSKRQKLSISTGIEGLRKVRLSPAGACWQQPISAEQQVAGDHQVKVNEIPFDFCC